MHTRTSKEVKRLNPNLNSEELTVENSMSKSFHKILQRELDPVWHQLSGKSRQLVSDLTDLDFVRRREVGTIRAVGSVQRTHDA